MDRASGVLLHISSLWGEYRTGGMGKAAEEFVDFLFDCGFKYWQMLPVCITDGSNSPYKSPSAFAFNPWFVDIEELADRGLITKGELEKEKQASPYACEFDALRESRLRLLLKAAGRAEKKEREAAEEFALSHPEISAACGFLAEENSEGAEGYQFIQYTFFRQWKKLREYAAGKGVRLIGDIPIYVADNSCDVRFHPEQFLLDGRGAPSAVAGVPPDYFSPEGQLWGNPLYDWKAMKKDGYSWWRKRLRGMFELFDGVRIDHFRGIESYWSVSPDASDARGGRWEKGPGLDFVNMLREEAGERLIIAEDLGDITTQVERLVKDSGFPGMRVFQFGFPAEPGCPHRIHNYISNCVAYSGTHDNNTLLGYLWEVSEETRREIYSYTGSARDIDACRKTVIRLMLMSAAGLCVFPLQDLLGYGADTRMNVPGRAYGNWSYRVTREQLEKIDRKALREMNVMYGRT